MQPILEWKKEALNLWNVGKAFDAGLIIITKLSPNVASQWSADILSFMLRMSDISSPLCQKVIQLAKSPSEWGKGHQLFSEIRAVTLAHDEKLRGKYTRADEMLSDVLTMSEQVAKLAYNATDPVDEFDDDTGAWVVDILHTFAASFDDTNVKQYAWRVAVDIKNLE